MVRESAQVLSDDERENFVPAYDISDEIRVRVGKKGTLYENWRTAETLSITGSPPETQPASTENLPPIKPLENLPPENIEVPPVAENVLHRASEIGENLKLESLRAAETVSAEKASKLENLHMAENVRE